MALSAIFQLIGYARQTGDLDLSTPADQLTIGQGGFDPIQIDFADGFGADQANLNWHDERTLADGEDDQIDLFGALTDGLGNTGLEFAKVKMLLVVVDSPNGVKELRIGPQSVSSAMASMFGSGDDYHPCRDIFWAVDRKVGWTVTQGTGDLLVIANESGTSITYRIWVIGSTG